MDAKEMFKLYKKKEIENQIDDYTKQFNKYLKSINRQQAIEEIISGKNYLSRRNLKSCSSYNLKIKAGDIVFMDFGQAYEMEMGYQHFALVLTVYNAKALVLPMSSNKQVYNKAYDKIANPNGNKQFYRIDKIGDLFYDSVLYLNDCRYINTARIIDIKASIDPKSATFKQIVNRFIETILL